VLKPGTTICLDCINKKQLFSRLLPYAKPFIKQLAVAALLFIFISVINVVLPILYKTLINDYITAKNPDSAGFILLIGAITLCGLAIAVAQLFRQIITAKTSNKILVNLREVLYGKIQQLSLTGITRRSAGELITRITSDTMVLKDFLVSLLPELVQQSLIIIGVLTIMFIFNWQLTLIVLIPVPLFILMFSAIRKYTHGCITVSGIPKATSVRFCMTCSPACGSSRFSEPNAKRKPLQ
jgi:ATP-binding cassette subfamily B protein